jgi:hypothetical protein
VDLPYTFVAPGTYDELKKLLAKHCTSPHTLDVILQRVRVCNAIKLNSDNRHDMQVCAPLGMRFLWRDARRTHSRYG